MEQEHWIKQNLIYYTKICKGSEGEAAISNCAMSMAKILNGLSEMRYTQFHRYEKQIFWNAMKLFSEQCIKQIGYALDCEDVTEKKIVISDIEESISDMSEVFKNIFGGWLQGHRAQGYNEMGGTQVHDVKLTKESIKS